MTTDFGEAWLGTLRQRTAWRCMSRQAHISQPHPRRQ